MEERGVLTWCWCAEQFTVLFWMNPLFSSDRRATKVFPMITIYQSVAPPVPFIQISADENSNIVFRVWGRCDTESTNATLSMVENLFYDEWDQFAITVDPPSPVDGRSKVTAMIGTRSVSTLAHLKWCRLEGVPHFVDGISIVQKETLFSPIQVRPLPSPPLCASRAPSQPDAACPGFRDSVPGRIWADCVV